jgi:hypothetical protein
MGKPRNHLGRLYTRVVPKKVRKHTNKVIKKKPAEKGRKIVQDKVDRVLWGKKRR